MPNTALKIEFQICFFHRIVFYKVCTIALWNLFFLKQKIEINVNVRSFFMKGIIILQWWKLHIAYVVAFDSVRLPAVHVKLAMMKLPCLLDFKMW